MTNEELEKAIDFLVNQQARFFSDMEGMKANLEEMRNQQAHTQKYIDHATSLIVTLADRQLKLTDTVEALSGKLNTLTDKVDGLADKVDGLAEIVFGHVTDKNVHRNGRE